MARVYSYNLDLGENYYSPMKDYIARERKERGETPGALTYSERIARRWCEGDKVRGGSHFLSTSVECFNISVAIAVYL